MELSAERLDRMADDRASALDEVLRIIRTAHETPQRNKANMHKFWLAFQTLHMLLATQTKSSVICVMHPAVKAAFEADFPPKHPEHRDLITIDFAEFFEFGIGEQMFAQLTSDIEKKISELVAVDAFHSQFEATKPNFEFPIKTFSPRVENEADEEPVCHEEDYLKNPLFISIYKAAQTFDTLMWMFEERQDILATFVRQYAVSMETTQPNVIRMRARRE
ncbi:hypothetical protein N7494_012470 [Penicillium frequentans]|uniref:Uncharacterized protein n=1 Tax=Penicillium frequentans TaxID=3151616 RepID=A0AAD6CLV2_9EURO|nr:hypothetical protein N7494_012470 [Penicillium glabrum]